MQRPVDRDVFFRLYAAEISYFSAKVRPAFRYKRIPHVEILATPDAYRRVIVPRTGLAMIPVVVTPEDETIQDSSDILDALEARFPDPPLFPPTPLRAFLAVTAVAFTAARFFVLFRPALPAAFDGSARVKASASSIHLRISGALPETPSGHTTYAFIGRPIGSNGFAPRAIASSGFATRTTSSSPKSPVNMFPFTNAQGCPNIARRSTSIAGGSAWSNDFFIRSDGLGKLGMGSSISPW